jgi:predicted RNA-binding Zn-ribbon protein involved in translation (DUF1610 family)
MTESATERAVIFYCPYCGDEDLRPEPEPRGAWRCVSCARVFTVTYLGLSVPHEGASPGALRASAGTQSVVETQ